MKQQLQSCLGSQAIYERMMLCNQREDTQNQWLRNKTILVNRNKQIKSQLKIYYKFYKKYNVQYCKKGGN